MNMVKEKIRRFIKNQIEKFKGYLSVKKSLDNLMEVAKDFYFFSIGINEIKDGIKNSKRFRITILHTIFLAILTFLIDLFSISNYLFSLLKENFLPNHFRIIFLFYSFGFTWILVIKIDMILAEIKFNLSPLKVFYFLINDLKSEHKLNDSNFNRLAILSRIVQIGVLEYGTPMVGIITIGFSVLITILSQKLVWILFTIYLLAAIMVANVIFSCWMCINMILFSYYKFRFDQINSSIKSIIPNGKLNVINRRKQKQLIKLIDEHKSLSNEVYKLNLMLRRSAGITPKLFTAGRTIFLFVFTNFNNNIFVNIMMVVGFWLLIFFGFGLTYLFSRQIKSAHQSNKLIYSILCRFNMRLSFRFKVNQ